MDTAPSYLFDVINDIQSINSVIKVHVCPWSPVSMKQSALGNERLTDIAQPGWMTAGGKIGGGKFPSSYTKTCRS